MHKAVLYTIALVGAITCSSVLASAQDESTGEALNTAELQARNAWRETMHAMPAPASGCFSATFPLTNWEEVKCEAPSAYHSISPAARTETTGNGFDYVVAAPAGHHFNSVTGAFPQVKNVKSEKGVGVALFGGGGILGTNEYTVQLNTDFHNSAACKGFTGCLAWEQFIISSNYVSLTGNPIGKTAVFIEYWLINYGVHTGRNICPSGFLDAGKDSSGPGDDCVQNSPATVMSSGKIPITQLGTLSLAASEKHGGVDEATGYIGNKAYKISVSDSLTDISTVWNQAEFNVVGNAGGSRADFNSGSQITVGMQMDYGSEANPACISPGKNDGTTGETNNLILSQTCLVRGGIRPAVQFSESN